LAKGDIAAALNSYQTEFALAQRLAKSDPNNARWQRSVAAAYGELAEAFEKSRQVSEARKALAAGRDIMAQLLAQRPDTSQWKDDLAWFDQQIAALKN
jgi:hypothetical protein